MITEKNKLAAFKLPESLLKKLNQRKVESGISLTFMVKTAIQNYLTQSDKENQTEKVK